MTSSALLMRLTSLVLVLGTAELAAGRPLTVRARTQASVEVERRPDSLVIHGRLRDDLGDPLASERVRFEVTGHPPVVRTTDALGAFSVTLAGPSLARLEALHGQRLPWSLHYSGDRVYGHTLEHGVLDTSRVPTRLAVTVAPEVVALDESEVRVHVDLSAQGAAVDAADVRVRVGDGTELLGVTGTAGRATFLIRAGLLGSAGTYAIHARFVGDQLHAAAEASGAVRVLLAARVTLRVGREGDIHHGRYRFSGRLADAVGPLAGATVAIVAQPADDPAAEPAILALTTTHPDGIYLTALPAADLFTGRDGELDIRAVFNPTDGRHQGAMSQSVRVRAPPAPGLPAQWYLLALVLVFGLLLAAQIVRHRVLRAIWRRLATVRAAPPDTPVGRAADEDPPFVTHEPRPGATGRRDSAHISGSVVDAHTQRPLSGASVQVTCAGAAFHIEQRTDAAGRFSAGPLPPGRSRLSIAAAGYLEREVDITLPHGGELDGATFSLVAIRRRLRDQYVRVVAQLGGGMSWGRDTPREAFVRSRRAGVHDEQALLELRRLVERAWFSRRAATVGDVARARQLVHHFEIRR